jgi:hypothetical protein
MLSLLFVASSPASVAARRAPVRAFPPFRIATQDADELARTARQAVRNGTTDEACTGWRSTMVPPPTIRVLRTSAARW